MKEGRTVKEGSEAGQEKGVKEEERAFIARQGGSSSVRKGGRKGSEGNQALYLNPITLLSKVLREGGDL